MAIFHKKDPEMLQRLLSGEDPAQTDLQQNAMLQPIGKEEIREAMRTLLKYRAGKANLERRIIENEDWWKLRHWDHIKEQGTSPLQTKSAWLVNVILSKHADAMDALPEPNCLPRAADDVPEAEILSKIIPVVLDRNNFTKVWSDNWWKKLKAGLAIYGVFWNQRLLNGMGDIEIRRIDPLELYWEPGILDIQDSRNVFLVTLADNDALVETYPELDGKLKSKEFTPRHYIYDDNVDTSDKTPVIDWYYKKNVCGQTVLHYVKFVGETVLYATENEAGPAGGTKINAVTDGTENLSTAGSPDYQEPDVNSLSERGLYDHGLYPFFFDILFPEEGTPAGFGDVDLCKDTQRQIDLMNTAIVANCLAAATPRWMVRGDGGVNEEEYADWTKPFVHVQGSLEEAAIKPIPVSMLSGNYISLVETKINELKETTGNRDVNNGGAPSGVTAASAIAAMQEQSGKLSRDQISLSYNCYKDIVLCVIELIRQFYDLPRKFRIIGADGLPLFVAYDNANLQVQQTPQGPWRPVFDIDVIPQKQSAYSKLSYNELAIQFFQLGFFNPMIADQALAALEMMEFKGKEEVRKRILQGAQMLAMQQMAAAANGGGRNNTEDGGEGAGAPVSAGGSEPVKIDEADSQGGVRMQNRIVDRAKERAASATQPR